MDQKLDKWIQEELVRIKDEEIRKFRPKCKNQDFKSWGFKKKN